MFTLYLNCESLKKTVWGSAPFACVFLPSLQEVRLYFWHIPFLWSGVTSWLTLANLYIRQKSDDPFMRSDFKGTSNFCIDHIEFGCLILKCQTVLLVRALWRGSG